MLSMSMPLTPDEIRSLRGVASRKVYSWGKPDLRKVGQDIYDLLNIAPKKREAWKKRVKDVQIKPDHLYGPKEVKVVLGVSYDTAVRTMERMKRTANLAKPRAKKRLLRVKGTDLRDYIHGKLE
jgi:hypothetical protein